MHGDFFRPSALRWFWGLPCTSSESQRSAVLLDILAAADEAEVNPDSRLLQRPCPVWHREGRPTRTVRGPAAAPPGDAVGGLHTKDTDRRVCRTRRLACPVLRSKLRDNTPHDPTVLMLSVMPLGQALRIDTPMPEHAASIATLASFALHQRSCSQFLHGSTKVRLPSHGRLPRYNA